MNVRKHDKISEKVHGGHECEFLRVIPIEIRFLGGLMMKSCFWLLCLVGATVFMVAAAGSIRADLNDIQFEEVTNDAGISYVGPSWGSAWGDFDGDGFPDLWLVNHYNWPALYHNQGNGTFIDIVSQVFSPEIVLSIDAHGAAWADFDNDGDQDLYQLADEGADGPIPDFFFVHVDGQLEEMAATLGLDYQLGRGRMLLWLDFDRDGLLDVLHPTARRAGTQDGPTALFQQTPTGFTDVADQVGLEPNQSQTSNFAQLADLSGNGSLELLTHLGGFPENVYDMAVAPFEDIKSALGITTISSVVDAAVADFDGDLDNDLFMVRGEKENGFVQVDENTVEVHLRGWDNIERGISFLTSGDISVDIYPKWSWSVDEVFIGTSGYHPLDLLFTLSPADTNVWGILEHNPGDPSIYIGYDPGTQVWQILRSVRLINLVIESTLTVSELSTIGWYLELPPRNDRLLVNLGNVFEDQTLSAGFLTPSSGRSVVAGDFDNDMDLDLYIVSTGPVENLPNILYQNQGDGSFIAVPEAGGAAGNSLGRGDAVTVADYDNDGFLDLLVTNGVSKSPFDQDGPTQLFRNLGNDNHWIEIDLEGVISNKDGIGARLLATAGGIVQLREQGGGIHCRGQNHQRVHFGLGSNTIVDELNILWPNGIVQVILDIPADQIIRVIEPVASEVPEQDGTPPIVQLIGCYPNPFNPSTTIAFSLAQSQPVKLSIHDAAGRLVHLLVDGEVFPAGVNEVVWGGRDDTGEQVSSGVYFLRLEAGSMLEMSKMVLLK